MWSVGGMIRKRLIYLTAVVIPAIPAPRIATLVRRHEPPSTVPLVVLLLRGGMAEAAASDERDEAAMSKTAADMPAMP